MNLGSLFELYVQDHPNLGDTARNILNRMQREPIAKVKAPGTARDYIAHCRMRRQAVSPSTVLSDAVYLRSVLSYAKPGLNLEYTDEGLRNAWKILRKEGLIGRSKRRKRVTSADELQAIINLFRANGDEAMADFVEFQEDSTRRLGETCRIMRGDLDHESMTILVRDMKHPSMKDGNHIRVALPEKSFAILLRQPRRSTEQTERFFPFNVQTIKQKFARAVRSLGYQDLHLHDLRRAGTTRLLKEGRPVPEVMLVTGHRTGAMVLETYNGLRPEDYHTMRRA